MKVPVYTSMEEAVLDIYDLMKPNLDGSPFAMFGHIMGALLVYEMIQKIHDVKGISPIHAFFSGRLPVHTIDQQKALHFTRSRTKEIHSRLRGNSIRITIL